MAVGGGSGGHVTPVAAVLRELKQHNNEAVEIRFWCDRKFAPQAKGIMKDVDPTLRVDTIISGKLRRYHHLTFLQHFTIPSVLWLNLRDSVFVMVGTIQSLIKLILWRPNVVFTKGGYVCVPVGWAAALLKIPLVIHDSDAHPGLANRLIARWSTAIATGAPLEYYSYPKAKTRYIGTPINSDFHPFTPAQQRAAKEKIGVPVDYPLIVVTGGGLGAKLINNAVLLHLESLLAFTSVVLISGSDQYDEIHALAPRDDPRFQLHGFVSQGMAELMGAADVIVTRAGATTLLEVAALAKPVVLVPNGRLTGGHQLKNAKVFADKQAAVIVDDGQFARTDDTSLVDAVRRIIDQPDLQKTLATNIHALAKPHAASDAAAMILRAAGRAPRRTSGTIDHKRK